jgi:osmotically-inducible protein OsmY
MKTDVRGVSYAIVAAAPEIDVEDLQEQIEDALEKRAERLARRIEVTALRDIVTVHGTVHSLAEKEAVLGVIRSIPSVRRVADQLWVEEVR